MRVAGGAESEGGLSRLGDDSAQLGHRLSNRTHLLAPEERHNASECLRPSRTHVDASVIALKSEAWSH